MYKFDLFVYFFQDQLFWEGHKIWKKNLPIIFDIFVAFLKYNLNFKITFSKQ